MNIALPQLSCAPRPVAGTPPDRDPEVIPLSWGRETQWNRYVETHVEGTVFHTLKWRNAVATTFHHASEYWMALKNGRVVGVLPMYLVRGPIIGRMLVSVPYAVGGGILADSTSGGGSADPARMLFDAARRRAADLGCSMIDFRSERPRIPELASIDGYVGFERELPGSADGVLDWLPRKARAVVRNARTRYALSTEFGRQHLRTVWRLYCHSMRRLGSINYPFRFFHNIASEFATRCWCTIARRDGRPIAGLLTLLHRDRVLPYFFGCEPAARECGAASLIYAAVMERAAVEGYRIFDFGRSRRDNKGSFDFKRFHGFEPRLLGYQRYSVATSQPLDLTPANPAFDIARRIWTRLPLAVTRPAGAFLSNYIPG
jgi:FemAB-related protein (PEP-CTERM system-associated)